MFGIREFLTTRLGRSSGADHSVVGAAQDALGAEGLQARMERHDLLHGIVRHTMVCAEILSSQYQFRILAVIGSTSRYEIIIALAEPFGRRIELHQWAEGEIQRMAAKMGNLSVEGVYWRCLRAASAGNEPPSWSPPPPPAAPGFEPTHPGGFDDLLSVAGSTSVSMRPQRGSGGFQRPHRDV